MIEIIPAILTDSSDRFKELVRRIEPYTSRIHIDIADGIFVPNKTVSGHEELKAIDSAVRFDVHLMVKEPQNQMKEWFHSRAERFIIHAESSVDLGGIIKDIKNHNRKVGIAVNPETGLDKIEPYLAEIDFFQFMTVHPGFQGGKFVEEVIDKITGFHDRFRDIIIMCDGAITPDTAPKLVKAGASVLIVGSYIVRSGDIGRAIRRLKETVNSNNQSPITNQ